MGEGRDMRARRTRYMWRPILLLPMVLLAACQLVGRPRPPAEPAPSVEAPSPEPPPQEQERHPLPQGHFRGEILVEGEPMQAHLFLSAESGNQLSALLEGPVEFQATGSALSEGEEVQIQLSYGGECPGTMSLVGSWDPEAGTLMGIIRANDCTGRGQGTFRFDRSSSVNPVPMGGTKGGKEPY